MRTWRLPRLMATAVVAVLLGLVGFEPGPPSVHAAGAQAHLMVWLNYLGGDPEFEGSLDTGDDLNRPADLGFTALRPPWSIRGIAHVYGKLASAKVEPADARGFSHLVLDRSAVLGFDELDLSLPFVNIDYAAVQPAPGNIGSLLSPEPANWPPELQFRSVSNASKIDIPFRPVRKNIRLEILPLLDRMLQGRSDAVRLSGHVTYDNLLDYPSFMRYCAGNPTESLPRVTDLLMALDAPPSGADEYQIQSAKPTAVQLSVDPQECHYEVGGGQVQATFAGTLGPVVHPDQPPAEWQAAMTVPLTQADQNRPERSDLTLGTIRLAPGDTLQISMTDATLEAIRPQPSEYNTVASQSAVAVYRGPARFDLHVIYSPTRGMFADQFPATLRSFTGPVERQLTGLVAPAEPSGGLGGVQLRPMPPAGPGWWLVALVPALVVGSVWRVRLLGPGLRWAALVLAGLALLYASRGGFGLLALAALAYAAQPRAGPRSLARLPLAGAVLLVIIVAEIVDRGAEQQLLAIHRSLQAEMSIWTPAVLLGLVIVVGILAAGVVLLAGHVTDPESARRRICQLAPAVSTIVIALLGLSAFDVLQKSLLSALMLCAAAAYLARRTAPSVASELEWPAVRHRLRTVVREPIVLGGFALFALLALQSGLQSTADVVGGQFGPLQLALDLFLLLTSVVEGFLAVGALFVILYPLLPGRTGYLKAICLAAFLTVIWVFGFGSQEQLIGPLVQLLAGRFLYYLCMPLLLGFVLELDSFRASAAGGSGGARGTPLTLTFGSYVKDFRGLAGTAATVVSLVAPGVYAAVAGAPLVATYFDLLDKWAKFSG